ncbi:ABC transporter permease [Ginsengibacter hankyongi]|uniref:ABC transporter permease n=1 Tax=Ginsengibacter hankyongi TaxID=2607284 RepID=A0A5J5IDS5_9BACT|nr:ABC transporter permease [Ginsengibacter hankyongi]KAA9034528.1 ABC transporter permease [Ginsengibacter hankyongi]
METKIPKPSDAFLSLMRADFTTQWRNRRSVIMSLLVPIIILISWKGLIAKLGGAFVFSIALTIGLTSIGMMGYAISVARDRDKGVFQRLRVTPVPTPFIMMSRLLVQLGMIAVLTLGVFIIGYRVDKIALTPAGYILTFITAFLGGALYLGFGQMIVGLIKNAETVNSTTRLVYIAFIMLGMFGELSDNMEFKNIIHWSPFGTVKTILAAAMQPVTWNNDATLALVATLAYALVFSFLGIKWFRWN